jgi:hypothetical protein
MVNFKAFNFSTFGLLMVSRFMFFFKYLSEGRDKMLIN